MLCKSPGISHIYKNIYISSIEHSYTVDILLKKNIHAILYLGSMNKSSKILNKYKLNNINHKFLKIADSKKSDIVKCFTPAWDFINKHISNGINILIHCRMGISRSPSIVAYYMARKMYERMRLTGNIEPIVDDILTLIKINRPCVYPNKHFIKQLKHYENIAINELSK